RGTVLRGCEAPDDDPCRDEDSRLADDSESLSSNACDGAIQLWIVGGLPEHRGVRSAVEGVADRRTRRFEVAVVHDVVAGAREESVLLDVVAARAVTSALRSGVELRLEVGELLERRLHHSGQLLSAQFFDGGLQ